MSSKFGLCPIPHYGCPSSGGGCDCDYLQAEITANANSIDVLDIKIFQTIEEFLPLVICIEG